MGFNRKYKEIINDIITDDNFQLIKNDNHLGTSKFDHCKRVSFLSYIIGKMFKGNISEVTRAGLLHDFFYGSRTSKEENSYLNHPKTSIINSKKYFNISDNEARIIETHMFHYALVKKIFPFINRDRKIKLVEHKPNSKEGIIVCVSDLLVSIYELGMFKIRYSLCLYLLFVINIMKY